MISIDDILFPNRVCLELAATTAAPAVLEVAQRLRGDAHVLDWNGFFGELKAGNSCIANENGYGVCIPHARTRHVSSMVMAAGRARQGIWFDDAKVQVHYIFVIGVPVALAADYLRIIGALARIFRSPRNEQALREAETKEAFIRLLTAGEQSL